MSRASAHMRHFAERLIAHEKRGKGATKAGPVPFRVLEKIHLHLAMLMGNAGFQALLSRALSLAIQEVPAMRVIQISEASSLNGLAEFAEEAGPEDLVESGVVLLAQLLGLLVAFIGEQLTLQMMQELWPKLSIGELRTTNG